MIIAIVTCYNEAGSIKSTLDRLVAELKRVGEDFRVVIVDDGSTDGSQKIYEEFMRGNETPNKGLKPLVEVIKFEQNRGIGEVFRAGFARAIEIAKSDDDMIVIVEADGTNELELLSRMRDEIKRGVQIVVASRYSKGSKIRGVPIHRRVLSRLLNVYLRHKYKGFADISDFSYFFKAASAGAMKRAFERYKNDFITAAGFGASSEFLIKLLALGVRASELPTKYFYQSRGKSKMKIWATIKEHISLMRILKLK